MRRSFVLLAVPLACVTGCDTTAPSPLYAPPPRLLASATRTLFDTTVSGDSCAEGENIEIDGSQQGHFDSIVVVLGDTGGSPAQCGDLTFTGRTRTLDATFALAGGDGLPYVYWWRGSRRGSNGTYALDSLTRRDSVAAHEVVHTGELPMPLVVDYDGVGAVLILSNDSTLTVTDSAFLQGGFNGINYALQDWQRIQAPVLDSAKATDSTTITLWWRNHHHNRAIDSTIIFRNGAELIRLGHSDSTYADTGLADGRYIYRLKHFSVPIINTGGLAFPNGVVSPPDTVNRPPEARFGVSCDQLLCTFADSSSDPDGSIVSWRWTFGDGDSSSVQNPTHTYAAGGWYTVRLIVTDDWGAADTTTRTAAPLQLAIAGPTTVKPKVTCEWDAYPQGGSGEFSYSWRIGGQEVGTDESLYWYTGISGFQITLIGQSGDGQVDTAAVTVTLSKNAPSCLLKRG